MAAPTYVVTDIECTGFWPGRHSMISFASVAVTATGEERGRFEAVLSELPEAGWDAGTRGWFENDEPDALAAATTDPRDPGDVMADFIAFADRLPGPRVFAAHPVAFDGLWVDFYLRRFTPYGLRQGLYERDGLFDDTLCLRSYAAAVTGLYVGDVSPATLPPEWLGDVPHTHRAIDDALGYSHLLVELLRRTGARQKSTLAEPP
jgi:DNA polymerase III epsilon subunit-like protein